MAEEVQRRRSNSNKDGNIVKDKSLRESKCVCEGCTSLAWVFESISQNKQGKQIHMWCPICKETTKHRRHRREFNTNG